MIRHPYRSLAVLRLTAVLHAIAAFLQPVLAGVYLSGSPDAMSQHSLNANLVAVLCLALLVVAILHWRPGRGSIRPALAVAALFVAEVLQQGFGYSRQNAIHIPLGVGIVFGATWFAIWMFRIGRRATRSVQP